MRRRATLQVQLSLEELVRSRQVVRSSAKLLSSSHRWTRRALGRDRRGREVLPDDPAAVRWCMAGALLREGALIDKAKLRLIRTARAGNIGAEDVVGSQSGLTAVKGMAVALADVLEREGAGKLLGREFFIARGSRRRRGVVVVPVLYLPEFINDDRAYRFGDIESFLREADKSLTRRIREKRATRQPRQEGRDA